MVILTFNGEFIMLNAGHVDKPQLETSVAEEL